MSTVDIENVLRTQLRRAIDPKVPDVVAEARVMRALAGVASGSGLPQRQQSRARRNIGAVLVAAVVVLVVGGALGVGLGLRNRVTTGGPQPPTAGHPILSSPASSSPHVTACDGNSIQARFTDYVGAAGSDGGDIVLHNSGGAACTMEGYVSLQGLDNGRPVHIDVTHGTSGFLNNNGHVLTVQPITLEPGQDAYVAMAFSTVNSGPTPCPTATALLITPPQGSHSVTMTAPVAFTLCGGSGNPPVWIDEAPVSAHPYFKQ